MCVFVCVPVYTKLPGSVYYSSETAHSLYMYVNDIHCVCVCLYVWVCVRNRSVCVPINCLGGGKGSSQVTGKQNKSSGSACQDRINKCVRPKDDSHLDKEQNENNGAENPPTKK